MLEIINVSYYYKTNKSKKILDEVSMQFEEGVFMRLLDQVVLVRLRFYLY